MDKASWQKLERAYGARIREVYPDTLIDNGGLESWSGGLPVGWEEHPGTAVGPITITENGGAGAARYGSGIVADVSVPCSAAAEEGGLKIVITDPQWKEVQTERVSFSAWVKVTNVPDQSKVRLVLRDHTGAGDETIYSPPWDDPRWLEDTSGDWKLMSVSKEIRDDLTNGGSGELFAAVIARATAAETIDFSVDDAVFVKGVYPQGISKIPDPLRQVINVNTSSTAVQRAVTNAIVYGHPNDNQIRIMPGTTCVDSTGNIIFNVTSVITVDPDTIGLNGRQDESPKTPPGWYWLYLLANGSTPVGTETSTLYGYLKRADSTAFNPPGSYTYRRRIGCVYIKSDTPSYIIRPFYQIGHKVSYIGDYAWEGVDDPAQIENISFGNWRSTTSPGTPPDTMCACLTDDAGLIALGYPFIDVQEFILTQGESRSKMVAVDLNAVLPPLWRNAVGLSANYFQMLGRFRALIGARSGIALWVNIFQTPWSITPNPANGRGFINQSIREDSLDTSSQYAIRTHTFEAPSTAGLDTIAADRRIMIGLQKTGSALDKLSPGDPLVMFCDGYDDPLNHVESILGLV